MTPDIAAAKKGFKLLSYEATFTYLTTSGYQFPTFLTNRNCTIALENMKAKSLKQWHGYVSNISVRQNSYNLLNNGKKFYFIKKWENNV